EPAGSEGDCVKHGAAVFGLQAQLEVMGSDHAPLVHAKATVEQRLRPGLSPRAGIGQGRGCFQRKLLALKAAVGANRIALEAMPGELLVEGSAKIFEAIAAQRQAGGSGMAAETVNQTRVACIDADQQ